MRIELTVNELKELLQSTVSVSDTVDAELIKKIIQELQKRLHRRT